MTQSRPARRDTPSVPNVRLVLPACITKSCPSRYMIKSPADWSQRVPTDTLVPLTNAYHDAGVDLVGRVLRGVTFYPQVGS